MLVEFCFCRQKFEKLLKFEVFAGDLTRIPGFVLLLEKPGKNRHKEIIKTNQKLNSRQLLSVEYLLLVRRVKLVNRVPHNQY